MKTHLLHLLAIAALLGGTAVAQSAKKKTSGSATPRSLDELIIGDSLWDTTPDQFEEKFDAFLLAQV